MSVKQNNSRFFPGAPDLPSCGFLGQVTVAGMCPIFVDWH